MTTANYTILETLSVAGMGWGVVFIALITMILCMWALMKISSAAGQRSGDAEGGEASATPTPAVQMIPASGSQGEIALHTVDDKTAAMVMAIVADKLDTPLNELRFRSIREQKSQKGEGKK